VVGVFVTLLEPSSPRATAIAIPPKSLDWTPAKRCGVNKKTQQDTSCFPDRVSGEKINNKPSDGSDVCQVIRRCLENEKMQSWVVKIYELPGPFVVNVREMRKASLPFKPSTSLNEGLLTTVS